MYIHGENGERNLLDGGPTSSQHWFNVLYARVLIIQINILSEHCWRHNHWPCLKSQRSRARPPLWYSSCKETNVSSPIIRNYSVLWGASVTERYRARPQSANARLGESCLSGGQCYIIHVTIVRRLSWPSLTNLCTKVA